MHFVILGQYGCPCGFLAKSLPVIVHWATKYFESIFIVERHLRDMLSLPFSSIYHDFCIFTTLSQDKKLTHDKTLLLGFTKKIGQLQDMVFCRHFSD